MKLELIKASDLIRIQPTRVEAMAYSLIGSYISNVTSYGKPKGICAREIGRFTFQEKIELSNLLKSLGYNFDIVPSKNNHPQTNVPMESYILTIDKEGDTE